VCSSDLFEEWLKERRPNAAKRVMTLMRNMRGGQAYDPRWGTRAVGEGPYAELMAKRFETAARRFGLARARLSLDTSRFRRPPKGGQLGFFDDDTPDEPTSETQMKGYEHADG